MKILLNTLLYIEVLTSYHQLQTPILTTTPEKNEFHISVF